MIHKSLFSLELSFSAEEGSTLHIAKRIWKLEPAYYAWFNRLLDYPFMLFFLHDAEDRYYALLGDLLATGELVMDEVPQDGLTSLPLTPAQLQAIEEKLFRCCLSLLFYCHGSGFNPEIFVQGILASFEASFTFEDVLCEYAKDVLKGSFRVLTPHQENE